MLRYRDGSSPARASPLRWDLVNDFDVEARRTLALVLDGGTIAQREVVLSPGEAKTEVFTFEAPDVAGIHRVEMDGQVREFEVVAQIVETSLDLVSPLTVSPEQVELGQLVTITAILRNSGEEEGRMDVILKIGGGEVDRRTVVVPGSSEVPVTFTVTRHEAGDYAVEVEAVVGAHVKVLRGSFRAVSAPSASTESPGPTVAAEPADTAPAATPVPTPLPSPTPSPSPRFSCGAPRRRVTKGGGRLDYSGDCLAGIHAGQASQMAMEEAVSGLRGGLGFVAASGDR